MTLRIPTFTEWFSFVLNLLKDSQMMWLLCTDIATIVFWAAFLNTLSESIVKEGKLPEASFSSLHDLAYSKRGNTKSIMRCKGELLSFSITTIIVFIRTVNTVVVTIAHFFLGDALSTTLKSSDAL